MPRSAGSSSSMISTARGLGAPDSVPAGNAEVNTSNVPATEWQETRNKAEASVEAIQIAAQLKRL